MKRIRIKLRKQGDPFRRFAPGLPEVVGNTVRVSVIDVTSLEDSITRTETVSLLVSGRQHKRLVKLKRYGYKEISLL